MATPDRPAAELTREERIAALLVGRLGLAPPIDVEAAARGLADIERDWIPGACDGLVVGLHGGRPRPLILLDRTHERTLRERFTLAHELGHVLLPWHVGDTFLCETSRVRLFEMSIEANPEPEANRFAAELLVPTSWLQDQMAELGTERVLPLMQAIREAQVSAYVACLRLRALLPGGHAFVISSGGTVLLSGRTQGEGVYQVYPPEQGQPLERGRLDRFAQQVEDMAYGPTRVTWWTFRGEQFVEEHAGDPRSARQILDALLERHVDPAARAGVRQTLAGVIGSARGEALRVGVVRAAELFVRFRGRFAVERDRLPDALLRDADFEIWLHKRAEELGEAG